MKTPDEIIKELESVVNSVKSKAEKCNITGISQDITNFNDSFKRITRKLAVRFGSSLTLEQEKKLRELTADYELAFEDIESNCSCLKK